MGWDDCYGDDAFTEDRLMKRLNIVVPFRARESHLQKFVPTMRAYFARDKLDCEIPYRVLIIEQDNELPFNRGAINNIGFLLGRDTSDYTCFHDVDYLPIWADYRWPEAPMGILWHGAESRPVAPGRSTRIVHHSNMEDFFGGVFLVANAMFDAVNGYANCYWGWGYEDVDLKNRFTAAGIRVGRRRGTFSPLEHDHEGYDPDGARKPISQVNERIFESHWSEGHNQIREDGLNNLSFDILDRRPVPEESVVERPASWEIVTVRLRMRPRREQTEAIAGRSETMDAGFYSPNEHISRNAPCPCGSGKKFKHCHGANER
jgi:hypothetical protein